MRDIPVALTIAGSDSSGGAGIQADLKTFQAYGVFGTSAITAVTVQNTLGVQDVLAVPAHIVRAQIDAVASDLKPGAWKTGMLATSELVMTVARAIQDARITSVVVDPVMIATSGDRLLDADAERSIVNALLPLAALVTPNLDEATVLAGFAVRNVEDMERAARHIVALGARAALVKGGHLDGEHVIDVLFDGAAIQVYESARIDTRHTHGTGCTLSAAITADLACGRDLRTAVERGLDFVHRAIETAPNLGHGAGPLNHFLVPRPLH